MNSQQDFFSRHGKHIQPHLIARHSNIPFIEHPQFQHLIDILARKHCHHAALLAGFSPTFFLHIMNALSLHLTHDHVPVYLRDAEVIYLDMHDLPANPTVEIAARHDENQKIRIIALINASPDFVHRHLAPLLTRPELRFIMLARPDDKKSHDYLKTDFNFIELLAPSEKDILAVLKEKRSELEQYHHVTISDECLVEAFRLAERFLSADHSLDKALQLLDSAAARLAATEHTEKNGTTKPVLAGDSLANILANWTQIPASHLQLNKFKLTEFTQGMRQKIFGQDVAVTIFGHALQQAHARLRHNLGPFCSFLFAGPEHSGKKSAALALVEQLFKQLNILYFAQPFSHEVRSITDIKLQRCHDKHYATLKDVIREIPYAVFFFNHVDMASPGIIDNLHQIFATGHMHDEEGNDYNFRQATIILSTTLGAEYLTDITKLFDATEGDDPVDLMQLIMTEQKNATVHQELRYSPQELVDGLMPIITPFLPESICQHLHVVPFIPLDKSAIEKIIHLKLKLLDRQLEMRYAVELTYAQEVIRHLAREVSVTQDSDDYMVDIDKVLRQLYFCIEHAIFSQVDNPNRPTQLLLQLNETGQLLRCDWATSSVRQHGVGA